MATGTKQYRGLKEGVHTWRLRVRTNGRQVSETFKVKATGSGNGSRAADDALAEFVARTREDEGLRTDQTLRSLWVAWKAHLETRKQLSPNTLSDYINTMETTVVPALGSTKLRDLTSRVLDDFYSKQLARGVTCSTVNKYHRVLSSMLRQAEKWGWIKLSPTRTASPPKPDYGEVTPPSLETVKALVKEAGTGKIGLLIALAPVTGARRGELVGLKWSDINFRTGVLTISRSAYKLSGGDVRTKSTKSGKPRRVSLDPAAVAALRRAYEAIKPESGDFIFSDDGKAPWPPDRITLAFRRIRHKVGADDVRLHDLRHFSATQLIASGVDMVTVSKRLGHAKVSTTSDIYAHALELRDQDAALILGAALSD